MRIVKGVPLEKFERLLSLCDINIIKKRKSYYEVELPIKAYADNKTVYISDFIK